MQKPENKSMSIHQAAVEWSSLWGARANRPLPSLSLLQHSLIIRISPPSYPTVCTQSKQLPLFFMLGKAQKSFSCYLAPTWYCRVKREENSWNISLTLLAEISGALSCLGNDRSCYVHGILSQVNCEFESSAQP